MRSFFRRGALPIAWLCAALALIPRPAGAWPKVEGSARLRLDTAYDSNVFNGRGPDFEIRVTPQLGLWVHDLRNDLRVTYDLGLWFYVASKADNSVNHLGVLVYDRRLTRRLSLHLADEILYAGDPGFLPRAGVVAPQTSILDNQLDSSLSYRLTRRLTGTAWYSYRLTRFGAPPAGSPPLFDGDEHNGLLSLAWNADRLDELRLAYRVQYFTADSQGLAVSHTPTLAWRRHLLRSLDLRLEAGPIVYQQLDGASALNPNAPGSGVTWRGAALLRLGTPVMRVSLSFARDLVGGTGAAAVLWAMYGNLRGSFVVDPKVALNVGIGGFANGYAPNEPTLYDGFTIDGGFRVAVNSWLEVDGYWLFRYQQEHDGDPHVAPLVPILRNIVGLRVVGTLGTPPGEPPKGGLKP